MKILSTDQIRALDTWTIAHEPIDSIDLMERAARTFTSWFTAHYPRRDIAVCIFCGPGNNGGDGLAVARLLAQDSYQVHVWLCRIGRRTSPEFDINLSRLRKMNTVPIHELTQGDALPRLPTPTYVIDALLGSGLSRPVTGYWATLLQHLNAHSAAIRVAIDIPSGLFAERPTEGTTFHAHRTLSFEVPKLAFFFSENYRAVGEWEVRSIGLDKAKLAELSTPWHCLTLSKVAQWLRPRHKFDHKGTFGHALIMAGSKGMMGAAVLSTQAALRSGAGLVTAYIPECGYSIMQMRAPEAMALTDPSITHLSTLPQNLDKFSAIGIGPGLGRQAPTLSLLEQLLSTYQGPIVIDADALNLIATHPHLFDRIPPNAILTPHPKEFARLFGESPHTFARLDRQMQLSKEKCIFIVLKGAHTCITTPKGTAFFNTTGNVGMATGGSGDVLTGLIAGLLAQGYSPSRAACLGVWLHGLAGELASSKWGAEAMTATDLIAHIGQAFQKLHKTKVNA